MKKFTLTHRLLHWTIGISIIMLFLTGFLRMEWMSKKNLSALITNEVSKEGKLVVSVDVTNIGTFEYSKFKNVTVTPEDLQVISEVFAVVRAEKIVE